MCIDRDPDVDTAKRHKLGVSSADGHDYGAHDQYRGHVVGDGERKKAMNPVTQNSVR